ncbi:MAG: hypothetical protein ACP6IP_07675 [Candidatus Njordarchaeia archaeon]
MSYEYGFSYNFLAFIFYLLATVLLVNVILNYMMSREIVRKVNMEIRYYEPLLASIYLSQRSLSAFVRFIINEDSIFAYLSKYLRRVIKKHPMFVGIDNEEVLGNWVVTKLVDITVRPHEILKGMDSYYMSLVEAAEHDKIMMEKLDEKISLVIFANFFIPFAIMFVSILEVEHIFIILALYPIMNVALIYFTIKTMFEGEFEYDEDTFKLHQ